MAIATRAGGLGTLRTRRIGGHLPALRPQSHHHAELLLCAAPAAAGRQHRHHISPPLSSSSPPSPARCWGSMSLHSPLDRRRLLVLPACCWPAQPSPSGISLGAGLALLSGPLLGAHHRHLAPDQRHGIQPYDPVLLFPGGRLVVLGATMPSLWIEPSFSTIGSGSSSSASPAASASTADNQAFRYGEASMVAPLDYTQRSLRATLMAFCCFGDIPSWLCSGRPGPASSPAAFISRGARHMLAPRAPQPRPDQPPGQSRAYPAQLSPPGPGLVHLGLGVFWDVGGRCRLQATRRRWWGAIRWPRSCSSPASPRPSSRSSCSRWPRAGSSPSPHARAGWAGMCSAASPSAATAVSFVACLRPAAFGGCLWPSPSSALC